jgi:hypothetical protein
MLHQLLVQYGYFIVHVIIISRNNGNELRDKAAIVSFQEMARLNLSLKHTMMMQAILPFSLT